MTDTTRARLVRALHAATAAVALGAAGAVPLMVATAGPAHAQGFRFDRVQVEGNQRIPPDTILSIAGLPGGQAVSADDVNAGLQALQQSGLFETVAFEPRGNLLVIRVEEFPTVNRISIEGNRQLDDDRLIEQVQSQPRRVFDPDLAEADANRILDVYRAAGRVSAAVEPRIIRRDDNRVDLVFEVFETRPVEIERLSFVGNRAFRDSRLRRVLQTKQAGLLRIFVSRDTLVEDRLALDRQLLTDFYLSRGYVDFRVLGINSELTRDRDAFLVTFDLREGQQFTVGDVRVTSEVAGVDADEYAAALRLRPGTVYSPFVIDRSVRRLEQLASQQGLSFVRVEPRITRDARNVALDVEFAVVRGPRIFVERIDIEGNETTLDRVIRRQFDTVEGDPFNPSDIRESAERIRALGFFTDATVESRPGSARDRVVVDVDVIEQPTGSFNFGGSFSPGAGFGFNIGFSESNFLGRGQQLSFSLASTSSAGDTQITFREPALLGRDVGFSFTAGYRTTDSFNASFNTDVASVQGGIDFPAGEFSRIALRAGVSATDISIPDPTFTAPLIVSEAERGQEVNVSLGYSYSYDTRGTGLNPDAGVFVNFGQDVASFGGDATYVRTAVQAIAETRLPRSDVLLKAEFEGGLLSSFSGYETRVTERYFTSSRDLRGFETRGIGPRQSDGTNFDDPLGGNAFTVLRLDATAPLPLPEEYGLTGGAFVDAGSVWSLDNAPAGVDDSFELRAAAGVSLIVRSPLGPLRFDFSTPLKEVEGDRTQSFDFAIATSF